MENIKLEKLKAFCAELNLSSESVAKVKETATELSRFEKNRPKLRTPPQQIKELDNLKIQANKLYEAIVDLSHQSHFELWRSMCNTDFPTISLDYEKDGGVPDIKIWDIAMLEQIEALLKAVRLAKAIIGDHGKNGGRLLTLDAHSIFISNMAICVCVRDSIEPGRGGQFERLCTAIFEAAGVRSKPEGAIKLFMKKHGSEVRMRMLSQTGENAA